MTESLSSIWAELMEIARSHGALRIGASPIVDENAELFETWLDSGYAAEMGWLEKNHEARRDPSERFPWARSVISITVPYTSRQAEGDLSSRVARYAQGEDYHFVVNDILKAIETRIIELVPEATTRRYVDTGPLSDRAYATQAGLGWIGKNSMLIDEQNGSYLFIGTILTSLENDLAAVQVFDRCGTCTRCIDACPTDAIVPGRMVDSNRCISYLTIEHRGPLPDGMESELNGWLFGCDICQEVCPWIDRAPEGLPQFEPRETYADWSLADLVEMTQDQFSTLFRRSAIKRTKHAGLTRNARVLLHHPPPTLPDS